jgi:hypothetical protein
MKNIILTFIHDFDKKLFKEILIAYKNIKSNQAIILTKLSDDYPDLQEISSNLQYIKQKSSFFK